MLTKKNKILVVDDSENNLFLLEEILCESNYNVITARGGKEAIEKISDSLPDLILLDIMMPDFSGYDVMNYLQTKNIQTPVIVISARASDVEIKKAYSLGAKHFIRKPVILSNVLKTVENTLTM